jgi:hypothetical protein
MLNFHFFSRDKILIETLRSNQPDLPTSKENEAFEAYNNGKRKNILFFNDYYYINDFEFGWGNKPFVQANCPVHNCFTTNVRSMFGKLYYLHTKKAA